MTHIVSINVERWLYVRLHSFFEGRYVNKGTGKRFGK